MHIDPYIVLGSAIIGLLVGMTGAGGGALMTPMLILLFGVTPAAAISSDLVASVVMRPIGAGVHMRAGTVNRKLVLLMASGSVPAAILGSYLLSLMGDSKSDVKNIELILGAALLIGAAAMVLRYALDRRSGAVRNDRIHETHAAPADHRADRNRRRRDRRHDLRGRRLPDDRPAAVRVSLDQRQAAGRHRPDPGGAADARRGRGRTHLRQGGVRPDRRR